MKEDGLSIFGNGRLVFDAEVRVMPANFSFPNNLLKIPFPVTGYIQGNPSLLRIKDHLMLPKQEHHLIFPIIS